jgi:hypothetical protein
MTNDECRKSVIRHSCFVILRFSTITQTTGEPRPPYLDSTSHEKSPLDAGRGPYRALFHLYYGPGIGKRREILPQAAALALRLPAAAHRNMDAVPMPLPPADSKGHRTAYRQ